MYLQLAEGENNGNYSSLAESVMDNYVMIPANFLPDFAQDTYVRADYFLKYDNATAQKLLQALQPYQTLSEGLVDTALSFVPGGPIASKGLDIAKKLLANRQQKVASGEKKALFKPDSKIGKLLKKVTGSGAPGSQDQTKGTPIDFNANIGGANVGLTYKPATPSSSFFANNKTILLIGGGLVAIAGIYLLTKKK